MNILLLNDNFYPSTNAPAQRWIYIYLYLKKKYNFTVISSVKLKKNINYIFIPRIFRSRKIIIKLLNELIFFTFLLIKLPFKIKQFDIYICSIPSISNCIIGLLINFISKKTLIVEVRDLWPESLFQLNFINKFNNSILEKLIKIIYKKCNKIIAVTPEIKKLIISKYNIPAEKISVVHNFQKYNCKKKPINKKSNNFGFLGTIGYSQEMNYLIDLASFIKKNNLLNKIFVMGDGSKRTEFEQKIYDNNLQNIVIIIPWSSPNSHDYFFENVSKGLVLLKNINIFKTVFPTKIFDYARNCIPVFCLCDKSSYLNYILSKFQIGQIIDYNIEKEFTKIFDDNSHIDYKFDDFNKYFQPIEHIKKFESIINEFYKK